MVFLSLSRWIRSRGPDRYWKVQEVVKHARVRPRLLSGTEGHIFVLFFCWGDYVELLKYVNYCVSLSDSLCEVTHAARSCVKDVLSSAYQLHHCWWFCLLHAVCLFIPKHFRGRKNRCYSLAVRAVRRAFVYATKARRLKKRNMRTVRHKLSKKKKMSSASQITCLVKWLWSKI